MFKKIKIKDYTSIFTVKNNIEWKFYDSKLI